MHVVGHDLQFGDVDTNLLGLLLQELPQSLFNLADKDWSTILGAPNDMVAEIIDSGIAMNPALTNHLPTVYLPVYKQSAATFIQRLNVVGFLLPGS
jgi:hypothetical protein